jgi:hypothetical protein
MTILMKEILETAFYQEVELPTRNGESGKFNYQRKKIYSQTGFLGSRT